MQISLSKYIPEAIMLKAEYENHITFLSQLLSEKERLTKELFEKLTLIVSEADSWKQLYVEAEKEVFSLKGILRRNGINDY